MANEDLQRASDLLAAAAEAEADDDRRERIEDIADQLDRFASADHGPDHGRLARFENALLEIEDGASDEVVDEVTTAHEAVKEYRSGVEGV
jgi:hypothetical protein